MLAEDESFITLGERKGREENADGWTGILAHGPVVRAGGGHSRGHWASTRLLGYLFPLALEISRRSSLRPAHRAAAHGAGLLRTGRAGAAQPPGTRLGSAHR